MVSHPNVCRVYDLGEADGRLFLSMEFIDGEDLSSLLRRIGRLPEDKALQVARKLCAGVQAAHDKGVIHRDLKPANVMLDGRGEPIITDFGLAGLAESIRDPGSGTPAYMAPEQRAGREVTARSDIYSLGLVLHEILTGKRPDETGTADGLNPVVKRVLDRCLQQDPAQRPASALSVARALPGGDPLEAALAAGETPSPEVVAAAGERIGLKRAHAAALVVATILGSMLPGLVRDWRGGRHRTTSPDELRVRARDLVRNIEKAESIPNEAFGLKFDADLGQLLQERAVSPDSALQTQDRYWYRSSPLPFGALRQGLLPRVWPDDPPLALPGMSLVVLDLRGRLIRYETVRANREEPASAPPDWDGLLRMAGIDKDKLTNSVSGANSVSWDYTDGVGLHYQIDGLTDHGHLRKFHVRGDWDTPAMPPAWPAIIETVLYGLAFWFAVQNYRLGRGDLVGARTVASVLFLTGVAWLLLVASDLRHWHARATPVDAIAQMAIMAGLVATAYMAMEPFVRRSWPSLLVTWTRLVHGEWRDATVGRDALVGMAVTAFAGGIVFALFVADREILDLSPFQDTPHFLARLVGSVPTALGRSVMTTFVLFLLRLLLRRDWAAGATFVALFTAMLSGTTGAHAPGDLAAFAMVGVAHSWLLLRFGMLALWAAQVVVVTSTLILTLDSSRWYAAYSYLAIAWIAIMAFGAYWVATLQHREDQHLQVERLGNS